jgi:hypothetical protein
LRFGATGVGAAISSMYWLMRNMPPLDLTSGATGLDRCQAAEQSAARRRIRTMKAMALRFISSA